MGWDEVHGFLDLIEDPACRTLVLLDAQTGLRPSELLGLQRRDVDLEAGTLSVQRAWTKLPSGGTELTEPKNGFGRVVPLPLESHEALRSLGEQQQTVLENGDFVLCHSDGNPLDPNLVTRAFKRMANLGEMVA